jgi:two-component system chemotaxis response regulator CheB
MAKKCGVLIVDDSATVRATLTELLNSDERLEVIAVAPDPYVAATRIEQRMPDVILLDLEMPRMDGLTFLKRVMAQHPIPVVICSSAAEQGSQKAFEALQAGAVEVITKPKLGTKQFLQEIREQLCDVVLAASMANLKQKMQLVVPPKLTADAVIPRSLNNLRMATKPHVGGQAGCPNLIAIGASTGGTDALLQVLEALSAETAGIVIVQHMPEGFTAAFSDRLNRSCQIEVREAADGDTVEPGLALIAPGNKHTLVHKRGKAYAIEVKNGPPVSRHRPSVDVLFRSVAQSAGPDAVGVILTGMGDDGAAGMLEMKQAGVYTIAQDRESCVVFGMPNEAIKRGGVEKVVPLGSVASLLMKISTSGTRGLTALSR